MVIQGICPSCDEPGWLMEDYGHCPTCGISRDLVAAWFTRVLEAASRQARGEKAPTGLQQRNDEARRPFYRQGSCACIEAARARRKASWKPWFPGLEHILRFAYRGKQCRQL